MTTVRINCAMCGQVNDHAATDVLMNVETDTLVFTCQHCGAFNDKTFPPAMRSTLLKVGVMTIDEMAVWIVDELTGEYE
jgi:uncharacterized Zn finger protein